MSYKILIVDDEPANLRLLERLFRREYQIVAATSGAEAFDMLEKHDAAVIISDQRMPGMTGIEFLKRAAEMRPHTVRIILTGYTDVNALVEAINSGIVYKYVSKPWVNEDLQQTVTRALQHYETIKNQHELRLQNERLQARLQATQQSFVRVVADMLDLKDPHAQGHARRTRSYAAAIGEAFNLEAEELEQLSLAAFLHEAANINIPNDILYKTTALSSEERRIVEHNFERGLQLLAGIPDLEEVASVIRYYHEQWDGRGYPKGLSGEQIPLHARIIAVADAYDEMTTRHPLKPNWTHNEAIERLQSAAGKKFDPEVVAVFCRLKSIGQIHDMTVEEEIVLNI
jgi:response regulator RpfG family c-di-GMP phosphodiesterase